MRTISIYILLFFFNNSLLYCQCWKEISLGHYQSSAIKQDGSLWTWGLDGGAGGLGCGGCGSQNTPIQVGADTNWLKVSTGLQFSLALKKNGTLWGWGWDNHGQLGDGTTINKNAPIQIGTDTNWVYVCVGSDYSMAIKQDGTLWAWGGNSYGQLGDGTTIEKHIPTPIINVTNAKQVSCQGGGSTLLLKQDGTLWSVGANTFGNLGNGTFSTNTTQFSQIGNDTDWAKISIGSCANAFHSIKQNGTLWGWGWNNSGQVGDSSFVNRNIPTQIGTSNNWLFVGSGTSFSFAIKTNGSLWGWGINTDGTLGDGSNIAKITPTEIGFDTNWKDIKGGYRHSVALKQNSNLFSTGHNFSGELGLGDNIDRNVFIPFTNPNTTITNTQLTICSNQIPYFWNGYYIITSGQYSFFTSCSAETLLNLTIIPISNTIVNLIICQGNSYLGYTSTGIFIDTLIGSNGCDSIRTLNLNVIPNYQDTIHHQLCQGERYFSYTQSGIYIDTFINSFGCDSIRILKLELDEYLCCQIFAPNAFTPNRDNLNDEFLIKGAFDEYNILIADRWGNIVYQSTNSFFGWDGKYKGLEMPIGTYYYLFKYRCNNSVTKMVKGDITLIR